MKYCFKTGVVAFLVAILLASTLVLACGEGGGGGKTTITIGIITDFTGPTGSALMPLQWAFEDQIKYYNDKDLIPGVKLRLIGYDGRMDPSRTLSGYAWLKERGANVMCVIYDYDAAILKPFAERDKMPIISFIGLSSLAEPPGWVFIPNTCRERVVVSGLKWIGEQWDQSQGILKIGVVTFNGSSAIASDETLKAYCQNHPDRFDYVAGFREPVTQLTWAGQVQKLKDCDYVCFPGITGTMVATFMQQYRAAGGKARFYSDESIPAFWDYLIRTDGWSILDGTLCYISAAWWTDTFPVVDLAKELLLQNHPNEADETMMNGNNYLGGFVQAYFIVDLVRETVNEAGANFDGQALYNSAVKFSLSIEGVGEWGFSNTERVAGHQTKMYQISAQAKDLVAISGRLSEVTD
jgi:hypothetical protein